MCVARKRVLRGDQLVQDSRDILHAIERIRISVTWVVIRYWSFFAQGGNLPRVVHRLSRATRLGYFNTFTTIPANTNQYRTPWIQTVSMTAYQPPLPRLTLALRLA